MQKLWTQAWGLTLAAPGRFDFGFSSSWQLGGQCVETGGDAGWDYAARPILCNGGQRDGEDREAEAVTL